jgi:hypothetical protein
VPQATASSYGLFDPTPEASSAPRPVSAPAPAPAMKPVARVEKEVSEGTRGPPGEWLKEVMHRADHSAVVQGKDDGKVDDLLVGRVLQMVSGGPMRRTAPVAN